MRAFQGLFGTEHKSDLSITIWNWLYATCLTSNNLEILKAFCENYSRKVIMMLKLLAVAKFLKNKIYKITHKRIQDKNKKIKVRYLQGLGMMSIFFRTLGAYGDWRSISNTSIGESCVKSNNDNVQIIFLS